MEEPGRLQSMGSLRVRHNWATSLSLFTFTHWRRKWQPTPVFLPGESQGRGSLVGCSPWGRRVGHDWCNLAAAAAFCSIDMSVVPVPYYFDYCNFVLSSLRMWCFRFVHVSQNCFVYLESLWFHTNFRMCSSPMKNAIRILKWIALNP